MCDKCIDQEICDGRCLEFWKKRNNEVMEVKDGVVIMIKEKADEE